MPPVEPEQRGPLGCLPLTLDLVLQGKHGTFPSSGMTQVPLGIPASPPRGARRTAHLAWRENRLVGLKLHSISDFTRLLQTANEKQNKNNCINTYISI